MNQTADGDGVIRRTRTGWVSPIAYPASPSPPEPSKLSGSTGVVPGVPVNAAMLAFDVSKEDLSYAFGERLLIADPSSALESIVSLPSCCSFFTWPSPS